MTAEGAALSFDAWWDSQSDDDRRDAPFYRNSVQASFLAGYHARDAEITALREENQRLRAIETAARGLVEIGNGVYAPTRIGVVISPGGWDALQSALTPPEEAERDG